MQWHFMTLSNTLFLLFILFEGSGKLCSNRSEQPKPLCGCGAAEIHLHFSDIVCCFKLQ